MVAENLPLGFLDKDMRLASYDEIAIANINKNKKESEERRKARKVMQCVNNIVGDGVHVRAEAKANNASKKKKLLNNNFGREWQQPEAHEKLDILSAAIRQSQAHQCKKKKINKNTKRARFLSVNP